MIKKVDTLANRLSYAMKMQNVGVCELERSSGVAKGLISRYVNGLKFPKDDNINRLSKALHVNPEWLKGYDVPIAATPVSVTTDEERLLAYYRALTAIQKEALLDTLTGDNDNA